MTTMENKTMTRIYWSKHFLTGNLAGITTSESLAVSDPEEFTSRLFALTPENPAADLLTGDLYYVQGISF